MFKSIHSVMIHASDVIAACDWYSSLLEIEPIYLLPDFPVLRVGNVEVCFHKADTKVGSGRAGTVVYWHVEHLDNALERSKTMGGQLHRGPLEIENGNSICQILDPFGNLYGLIGPRREA